MTLLFVRAWHLSTVETVRLPDLDVDNMHVTLGQTS